jgi:multicomponent Na+:H+ antiporter subunit G
MLEYLRLVLFFVLLAAGLFIQLTAVLGVNRFRFAVNRMHPAGMADTLGLLLMALAAVVYAGFGWITVKILFVVALFWITSPVCSHLIGRLVRETDEEHFEAEAKEWKP